MNKEKKEVIIVTTNEEIPKEPSIIETEDGYKIYGGSCYFEIKKNSEGKRDLFKYVSDKS